METILSLNNKKVVIGPGHAFVMIGERINPTRRKKLAATMAAGDFARPDHRHHRPDRARNPDRPAGLQPANGPRRVRHALD
jgi:hypothetical protein